MTGTGVDFSPYCIADAHKKHQERVHGCDSISWDGRGQVCPETLESFDLVACIGASWILWRASRTLNALQKMAAPESWIVVGEPYLAA